MSTHDTAAPAPRPRGRPPRTEDERAAHRTRLVDAAVHAVRAHGPEVSIGDMAAAAGVSKPVLYDEFGDKLGVADAIALRLADQVEQQVLALLATTGAIDFGAAVTAFVDALITVIDEEPELYRFLVRSLRTNDRGLLDNALARMVHERGLLLLGPLLPGVGADELRVLTDGWLGFVVGSVESWHAQKVPTKDRLVAVLAAVMRAGIAAAAKQPPA